MAHIPLTDGAAGIRGLLNGFPASARPLADLAQALMRGPSSLSLGERELLATAVSAANGCHYCTQSHAAAARELLGPERAQVDQVIQARIAAEDRAAGASAEAPISPKMRALLVIAEKVRVAPRGVADEDVRRARDAGADDQAIHDTVLIAAAFCLYNRYVDGLATWAPPEPAAYAEGGKRLAAMGYVP